ncbi:hypothetical protein ACQPZ8_01575 [Actinomadura nitritigenes]|uniref:hypothetical protein n=1 Tax=Actinomadura nitritigenes TaxID=134602 RepID=UPI003D92DC94
MQRIVTDLEAGGYLTRTRTGRRTHYTLHPDQPLDDDLPGPISALLDLLTCPPRRGSDLP